MVDLMPIIGQGRRSILVLCLSTILLVSCAEEETGPQFAGGPTQATATTEPATLPSTPQPVATPVALATPASVADLLSVRGAVDRIFVATGRTVWSITGSGEDAEIFTAPDDRPLLAIDAAPGGEGVAVLLGGTGTASRQRELVILDASGEELLRIAEFGTGAATPTASAASRGNRVDWSPQGDRLLIALDDGSTYGLVLDEDVPPRLLPIAVEGEIAVFPSWSPTGEAIAFIGADEAARTRSLRLYDVESETISDVVIPANGRFVVDFAWMPDGVSMLLTEGGELAGANTGIDLWKTGADGSGRALVASAGSVAPVAQVSQPTPSPDGRSVAYAVLVPGDRQPRVDSVWVRHLASGTGFRVSLPSVESVEDLWWTSDGLVIAVTTRPAAGRQPMLALLRAEPDGGVTAIWATPIGGSTPAATPVATAIAG